jgi:dephospho-CoA kinase
MPYLLGLTGNIACGKTTIGQMVLKLGAARYIDADALVHSLYAPGTPTAQAVIAAFGPDIVAPNGTVDRRALGARVFADPAALRRLEAIVHPAVETAVVKLVQDPGLASDAVVIIDAVKLLEGRLGHHCDAVWLVVCDPAEELRRLTDNRGVTAAEAQARLAAQPDNATRIPLVTAVIDNSGALDDTRAQVAAAWQKLPKR